MLSGRQAKTDDFRLCPNDKCGKRMASGSWPGAVCKSCALHDALRLLQRVEAQQSDEHASESGECAAPNDLTGRRSLNSADRLVRACAMASCMDINEGECTSFPVGESCNQHFRGRMILQHDLWAPRAQGQAADDEVYELTSVLGLPAARVVASTDEDRVWMPTERCANVAKKHAEIEQLYTAPDAPAALLCTALHLRSSC